MFKFSVITYHIGI